MKDSFRRIISTYILAPVLRAYYRIRYKNVDPVDKIIDIRISDIMGWYRGNRYDEFTFPGIVKNGSWNVTPKKEMLQESPKYKAIMQRYMEGKGWIETDLFKRYKERIQQGRRVDGYSCLKKLEKYYEERYNSIFNSIRTEGIRTDLDPIYVNIGAEGEIYYTVDGNHRLYMAMACGLDTIPVKVWMRHKKWVLNRDQYESHPDL